MLKYKSTIVKFETLTVSKSHANQWESFITTDYMFALTNFKLEILGSRVEMTNIEHGNTV